MSDRLPRLRMSRCGCWPVCLYLHVEEVLHRELREAEGLDRRLVRVRGQVLLAQGREGQVFEVVLKSVECDESIAARFDPASQPPRCVATNKPGWRPRPPPPRCAPRPAGSAPAGRPARGAAPGKRRPAAPAEGSPLRRRHAGDAGGADGGGDGGGGRAWWWWWSCGGSLGRRQQQHRRQEGQQRAASGPARRRPLPAPVMYVGG